MEFNFGWYTSLVKLLLAVKLFTYILLSKRTKKMFCFFNFETFWIFCENLAYRQIILNEQKPCFKKNRQYFYINGKIIPLLNLCIWDIPLIKLKFEKNQDFYKLTFFPCSFCCNCNFRWHHHSNVVLESWEKLNLSGLKCKVFFFFFTKLERCCQLTWLSTTVNNVMKLKLTMECLIY